MADTYTSSLRIAQQEVGANENTWGGILNSSLARLDQAIAGIVSVSVTAGNVTLSTANNADDEARNALIILTGTPGTTRTVTFPDVEKLTWVYNNSDSAATLSAGVGTTVTLFDGEKSLVYSDGATNIVALSPQYRTGTFTPTLSFGGGSTGITYSTQEGNYTKIGNLVFIGIRIVLTSKGSSTGQVRIEGLPFAAASGAHLFQLIPTAGGVDLNVAGGYYGAYFFTSGGSTTLFGREHGDNVATATISEADVSNTTEFNLSGCYRV